jgi:hypothetical protein
VRAALHRPECFFDGADSSPDAAGLSLAEFTDNFTVVSSTQRSIKVDDLNLGIGSKLLEHRKRVRQLQELLPPLDELNYLATH